MLGFLFEKNVRSTVTPPYCTGGGGNTPHRAGVLVPASCRLTVSKRLKPGVELSEVAYIIFGLLVFLILIALCLLNVGRI